MTGHPPETQGACTCPFCGWESLSIHKVLVHVASWCDKSPEEISIEDIEDIATNEELHRFADEYEVTVDAGDNGQHEPTPDEGTAETVEEVKVCEDCKRTFEGPNAGNALGGHRAHCPEKAKDDDDDEEDPNTLEAQDEPTPPAEKSHGGPNGDTQAEEDDEQLEDLLRRVWERLDTSDSNEATLALFITAHLHDKDLDELITEVAREMEHLCATEPIEATPPNTVTLPLSHARVHALEDLLWDRVANGHSLPESTRQEIAHIWSQVQETIQEAHDATQRPPGEPKPQERDA